MFVAVSRGRVCVYRNKVSGVHVILQGRKRDLVHFSPAQVLFSLRSALLSVHCSLPSALCSLISLWTTSCERRLNDLEGGLVVMSTEGDPSTYTYHKKFSPHNYHHHTSPPSLFCTPYMPPRIYHSPSGAFRVDSISRTLGDGKLVVY